MSKLVRKRDTKVKLNQNLKWKHFSAKFFRTTEDGQLEAIPETIQLLVNDMETHQKDLENEILVQDPANIEETEVTETQVIYQDDPGEMQETPSIFGEQGDEPLECHIREEQCRNVQLFIKGEPEMEEDQNDQGGSTQVFIEGPLGDEELEETREIQYGEGEMEMHLEQDFDEEENVDVKTGKFNGILSRGIL